jgi:excisionase family DNA binding protein
VIEVTLWLPPEAVEEIAARVVEIVLEKVRVDRENWPEWMSVETAARYLDVSPERVRKLQSRREIPFHQEGPGCRVFFRRSDLDGAMAELRQRPLRQ